MAHTFFTNFHFLTNKSLSESRTVELKETDQPEPLARAVCAFANAHRKATIWVGVRDDGTLLGVARRRREYPSNAAYAHAVKQQVLGLLSPRPALRVDIKRRGGVLLMRLSVPKRGRGLPLVKMQTQALIREGRHTRTLRPEEIAAYGARQKFFSVAGRLWAITLLLIASILGVLWFHYGYAYVFVGHRAAPRLSIDYKAFRPALSADNQWVYFHGASLQKADWDILRMHLPTGVIERVVGDTATDDQHPEPSADGQWLYYDARNNQMRVIRRLNLFTGITEEIFNVSPLYVFQPHLFDSGRQMVFTIEYPQPSLDQPKLRVTRVIVGEDKFQVISPDGYNCGNSAISPDNQWVAMTCAPITDDKDTALWVVSLPERTTYRLLNFHNERREPVTFRSPTEIVFADQNGISLYLYSIDFTTCQINTLSVFYDIDPKVSPDGTQLVFLSTLRDLRLNFYTMPTQPTFTLDNSPLYAAHIFWNRWVLGGAVTTADYIKAPLPENANGPAIAGCPLPVP